MKKCDICGDDFFSKSALGRYCCKTCATKASNLRQKALGKPLPKGAVVHHMGKPWDNHDFGKLVICPDQAYHFLLHKRARELGYEDNSD